MNALALIDMVLSLVARAQAAGALIAKARNEGRDVTAEELDVLMAENDDANAALEVAIAKAKGEGR